MAVFYSATITLGDRFCGPILHCVLHFSEISKLKQDIHDTLGVCMRKTPDELFCMGVYTSLADVSACHGTLTRSWSSANRPNSQSYLQGNLEYAAGELTKAVDLAERRIRQHRARVSYTLQHLLNRIPQKETN